MCNWRKESCHHLSPHCLHFPIAFALEGVPKIHQVSSAEVILMEIGTTVHHVRQECRPQRYFAPADYPRQKPDELDRPVERDDMTDFFLKFMETDQLGRIAALHRIFSPTRRGLIHRIQNVSFWLRFTPLLSIFPRQEYAQAFSLHL
jgi:hypothetical protein